MSGNRTESQGQGGAAAADGCEPVFLRFQAARGWAGSQPVVGLAPFAAVTALVSHEELTAAFGGLTRYEDAQGRTYLGVWGARKVGRFLTMLRTRGLVPQVSDTLPEGLRQQWRAIGAAASGPVSTKAAASQADVGTCAMLDGLDEQPGRLP